MGLPQSEPQFSVAVARTASGCLTPARREMQRDAAPPHLTSSPRRDPLTRSNLLEREAELAALDALLSAVPSGGRLVAIEGPAGIGKTRLLFEGRERAQGLGLRVLAARGSELEQQFAFGVVRQLFEPLLVTASAEEQAGLLTGAAQLARPIFDPAHVGSEPSPDASLAILHGLFWLTANVSDRQALVVVVDDLHWCDPPSLRWLAYVLQRLEGLPILILVALRTGDAGTDIQLLHRIVTDPLATVLRPGALSEVATGQLLAELVPVDADEVFRATLHEASGGNPLLARELAGAVAAERLDPIGANAHRLDELGGRAVSRLVALRLSHLPADARSLARAVALLGDEADLGLAAALASLDLDSAGKAAAQLGQAGIVHPVAPLRFVHPVVRAAVYAELSPVERNRGHTQAAHLLAETDADPERIAAQLLATSSSGESWATATLRAAATAALARGAPDSAVTYLRRALETSSPSERAAVRYELGLSGARLASPEAPEHLAAARSATADVQARPRIALELASALFTVGHASEAVTVLEDALRESGEDDPMLARKLEYLLIGVARFEPELYPRALRRLERLKAIASELGPGDEVGLASLASESARAQLERAEAVDLAERALAGGALLETNPYPAFLYAVGALMSAEHFDAAVRHCTEALDEARRRGLVTLFCFASLYRARVALLRGQLADAIADAQLSLDAIDLHGLDVGRPNAVAVLAHALVERGDLDAARELVQAAGVGTTIETYAQSGLFEARARLRLAEADPSGSLAALRELDRLLGSLGIRNPALSSWRSLAALACLGLGRRDEAILHANDEVALSREWGSPRMLGESLVAAGLAEGGDAGIGLLQEAVHVLASSQGRLEHARALVELGSALRRSNRRADAREPLRLGLELATLAGAAPLARRAETELLATGARPRRIASSGADSLTPSERRVAEMACAGATNRQIAQALFVTPKTVEVHLSSTYRKLGIRSRLELSVALGE